LLFKCTVSARIAQWVSERRRPHEPTRWRR